MKPRKARLIKEALFQHCKWSNLGFIMCFLYTLKVFLCIILGRKHDHLYRDEIISGVARFDYKPISWHPDPNVLIWTELAVGTGLFKNWFYELYSDSTPDGDIGNKGDVGALNLPLGRL